MKITPLRTVNIVQTAVSLSLDKERADWVNAMIDDITKAYKDDRDQAYTSLIEGIEGMSMPIGSEGLEKQMYDQALSDIIEKVVKPLYNKE